MIRAKGKKMYDAVRRPAKKERGTVPKMFELGVVFLGGGVFFGGGFFFGGMSTAEVHYKRKVMRPSVGMGGAFHASQEIRANRRKEKKALEGSTQQIRARNAKDEEDRPISRKKKWPRRGEKSRRNRRCLVLKEAIAIAPVS